MKTTKLLGVTFDDHLKFQIRSQQIIQKTRKSVHGLLTQKRRRVSTPSLVKFYKACIVPLMTYTPHLHGTVLLLNMSRMS